MGRCGAGFVLLLVALATAGGLACRSGSGAAPTPVETASLAGLVGPRWVLTELGRGETVPAEVEIDAVFEPERIAGSAGCNRYFASVGSEAPGVMRIGPIGATRRMCPSPAIDLEGRYLAALGSVSAWRLAAGRLELIFQGVDRADALVFVRAAGPGDEASGAAPEQRFRGHVVLGHEVRSFTACGSERERWLLDRTGGRLANVYRSLTQQPYQPLYVVLRGRLAPTPRDGFGADYDGALEALDLRHAAAETRGCAEDLAGLVAVAFGNEPFWRLEIAADAIRLRQLGAAELRFPHRPPVSRGAARTWTTRSEVAGDLEVTLQEGRCTDSMSGAYFAFRARVRLGDETWLGCGREGDA